MQNKATAFWFEFDVTDTFSLPPGIAIGCGVTAFSYDDAIKIMEEQLFKGLTRPRVSKVIENVTLHDLDQGHVIPNMKHLVNYGIWFPLGYE
jgi:hypothetical protein